MTTIVKCWLVMIILWLGVILGVCVRGWGSKCFITPAQKTKEMKHLVVSYHSIWGLEGCKQTWLVLLSMFQNFSTRTNWSLEVKCIITQLPSFLFETEFEDNFIPQWITITSWLESKSPLWKSLHFLPAELTMQTWSIYI